MLAKHRRRARGDAINRELRLGAVLELLGGTTLCSTALANWVGRAAAAVRAANVSHAELHRRGDAHLLSLAASGPHAVRGADDTAGADERARRTADRVERGALVVAAGLDELPRTVMIGLLLSTAPDGIEDASGAGEASGGAGSRTGASCVSGDGA